MAERDGRGGIGRLFARAKRRMRELREEDEGHAGRRAEAGGARARRMLQERRTMDEERARIEQARREFVYRETGGGYGGYGGTADRGRHAPEEGRFRAGFSGYGGPGRGLGGETWRGGEFLGGRERWRGAEFRGGGAETWRRRRRAAPLREPDVAGHPRGLGGGDEAATRMERGHLGPRWPGYRPPPNDKPRGLGAGHAGAMQPMERGWHPERPGEGTVAPVRWGGWGGPHPGPWAAAPGNERMEWHPPARDFEAEALHAERVGPGAWLREHHPGGHGPHRAAWEGGTEAERTAAWYGGADRSGWAGSGPSSERVGEWIGGETSARSGRGRFFGAGVYEARDDRIAQDFGTLGGPAHGRFGREPPPDRGGGRGFGGPLGRWQERARGEQGRPWDGWYRGRGDTYPIAGEAYGGRGHVGDRAYRDLERWGEGPADRRAARRFRERHEEGDHFRGP